VSARHGFAPAHYKTGLISIIRWGGKGGGSGGGGGGGSGLPNAGRSRPARVSACPPTLAHRRACARAPHARHTRASALRRLGNGETSEWESINFVHLARVRIRTRARTHARTHQCMYTRACAPGVVLQSRRTIEATRERTVLSVSMVSLLLGICH